MATKETGAWTVLLAASAEADFENIILWTAEQFGVSQARVYSETLSAAIEALTDGPTVAEAKLRDDIAVGILLLHTARNGHRGRHFLMFRMPDGTPRRIEVLRILHDAMDLSRHILLDADY